MGALFSSPIPEPSAVKAALLAPAAAAPASFEEAALLPDVRAFLVPVRWLSPLVDSAPPWLTRFIMHATLAGKPPAAGQPPLPGAPPLGETDLSLRGDDGAPLAARIYEPPHLAGKSAPLVIYIHGGGWIAGGIETHAPICRVLASALGWRVLAVTYRCAPTHQYPAAALDVLAAYKHVAAHGADFGLDAAAPRVVLSGDSAGGQLMLELGLRVRDSPGLLQPTLLAPIVPAVHMRIGDAASFVKYGDGFGLNTKAARNLIAAYLGATPELRAKHDRNAYLSPALRADFTGVAPILLLTAEFDILSDDGRAFVKTVNARGGSAEHMEAMGNMHACITTFLPSGLAQLLKFAARIKDKFNAI